MSPEQGPTDTEPIIDQLTTSTTEIDPSIDPTKLVVQEGVDVGRIDAPETSEGKIYQNSPRFPDEHYRASAHKMTEGLPVIGAEAENNKRDELSAPANTLESINNQTAFNEAVRDMGGDKDKAIEALADKAGTEAMATEVSERAAKLAKEKYPLASQELIEKFAQKAAEKFKTEIENTERKAEHNQGVQSLIDSLESPDKPLSEILPDLPDNSEPLNPDEEPETNSDGSDKIVGQGG